MCSRLRIRRTLLANGDPLPAGTFSNRLNGPGAAPPNVVIVLLDGRNTRFEDQSNAKRQFVRFLASVDPKDRIAVYTLGNKLRVLCDFTDSPEELQKILAKFRGSTGTDVITAEPDPSDTGNAALDELVNHANETFANKAQSDGALSTLAAFAAIAGHVADLPGRKTLVWLTGSLPFSLAGAAKIFNRANLSVYPVDARGLVGLPRQNDCVRAKWPQAAAHLNYGARRSSDVAAASGSYRWARILPIPTI